MNKQERIEKERKNLNLIEFSNSSGSHINCIKIFSNNTYDHEKKKFDICLELMKNGNKIMTEVKFKKGGRADIFDITKGEIIEIVNTENEESIKDKKWRYPTALGFRVIKV